MASSIKQNYLFNLFNTIAGMAFPMLTFPYASRILHADGIGLVNFYQSIITYITLFACLGIPLYGTREVAKIKADGYNTARMSLEILLLNLALIVLGYIAVAVICFTVPQVQANSTLFLILSASIFFTAIGCEWFYRGTEDFKYITIRGLIVRCIYVILLFALVHDEQDLLIYGGLTVLGTVGNNVFNFIRLRRKIKAYSIEWRTLKPFRHLNGALRIFLLTVSISIYTNLNIVLLGFLTDATAVGYFVGASKIMLMLLGIVTALQTTMLPRVSQLLANDQTEQFQQILQKSIDFILCLSIPLVMGLIVMSPILIPLFCGETYQPAIPTLMIIAPTLLLTAMSGVISGGALLPQGKENISTVSCLLAAAVNIISNIILVPKYEQNGTAIAAILTEATVVGCMFVLGRKYIPMKRWDRHYTNCCIGAVIMFIVCFAIQTYCSHTILKLFVIPIVGAFVYGTYLVMVRDSFAEYILCFLKHRIANRFD